MAARRELCRIMPRTASLLIAIGGGVYVDDALAQAEESVTVSRRESG